jgi:hypothetical protein
MKRQILPTSGIESRSSSMNISDNTRSSRQERKSAEEITAWGEGAWRNWRSVTAAGSVDLCTYSVDSREGRKTIFLPLGLSGFDSRQRQEIFLFPTASRPTLGPTQPPVQWVPGALSPGVKQPGREPGHSLPSSGEVENGGAIPPHVFIQLCLAFIYQLPVSVFLG